MASPDLLSCLDIDCYYRWTSNGDGTCTLSDTSNYGRGAGGCSSGDSRFVPSLGCETWGLITYYACTYGFHNAACCICTYSGGGCPSPMSGSMPTCTNRKDARTIVPSICPTGYVFGTVTLGVCFPPCLNGYDGEDVCWELNCPATFSSCNTALCSTTCSGTETTAATTVQT